MTNENTLQGLRVLNTRPEHQAESLTTAITEAGGTPIALPLLCIDPTPLDWLESINHTTWDQIIFVSANAVSCFFEGLSDAPDTLTQLKPVLSQSATTVGEATALALEKVNLPTALKPPIADSEHLLELPHLQAVSGQRILLVKGEGGRPLIEDTLTQRGASVTPVCVYQRFLPFTSPETTHNLWRQDGIDIILLTSVEAMKNLFTVFKPETHAWLWAKPCIVLSTRLAIEARGFGFEQTVVSNPGQILETLQRFAAHKTKD